MGNRGSVTVDTETEHVKDFKCCDNTCGDVEITCEDCNQQSIITMPLEVFLKLNFDKDVMMNSEIRCDQCTMKHHDKKKQKKEDIVKKAVTENEPVIAKILETQPEIMAKFQNMRTPTEKDINNMQGK